jgi:hypothetical protein
VSTSSFDVVAHERASTRPPQEIKMNKTLSACLLSFAALAPLSAVAEDTLARFEGGIGVQPVTAGPAPNIVLGVNPGGQPWVISSLSAQVGTDGRIEAEGRGLLLAGGNGIGTNGGQSVRARLICGGVGGTVSDSDLVPLAANGDFAINGSLIPTLPVPCNTPVLLIINAQSRWFAAGIVKQ